MNIYFDMDGTIADLYGVANWLDYLVHEDTTPYAEAQVMVNMSALARQLNRLQREGHTINIISWTSKNGSAQYNEAVAKVKRAWLQKHLKSVHFNKIHIIPFGHNKAQFAKSANDILFDDEEPNRIAWTGKAYDVNDILGVLKNI